jgi:hypothetical protein
VTNFLSAGNAHYCLLLPAVQHRPKLLIFDDMPIGMGCSQGVDLDIISHLDMLADMLRKVQNYSTSLSI